MKDRGHCNNGTLTRTDQPNDVVQERVLNKYGPTKRKANKKCKSKPESAAPKQSIKNQPSELTSKSTRPRPRASPTGTRYPKARETQET